MKRSEARQAPFFAFVSELKSIKFDGKKSHHKWNTNSRTDIKDPNGAGAIVTKRSNRHSKKRARNKKLTPFVGQFHLPYQKVVENIKRTCMKKQTDQAAAAI